MYFTYIPFVEVFEFANLRIYSFFEFYRLKIGTNLWLFYKYLGFLYQDNGTFLSILQLRKWFNIYLY